MMNKFRYQLSLTKQFQSIIQYLAQMKKLQNPTTFFFSQAESLSDNYPPEISSFVNTLLDKQRCILCRSKFTTLHHIPRIMVHCGHTFCTQCLNHFYMNRRVRCPTCLKLVKQIDSIERLPINHTIFEQIVKQENQLAISQGRKPVISNAKNYIFGEFERVQKQAHMMQNPQKIDEESGLPFCVFHSDRVEHFFCEAHSVSGCRVCMEVGHSKVECKVIDLYSVEEPQKYLNKLEKQGSNQEGKIYKLNDNKNFACDKNDKMIILGRKLKNFNFQKSDEYVKDDDQQISSPNNSV